MSKIAQTSFVRCMGDHLYMVPLQVPIAGFENFITAWVYTGGPVVLIDPGPSSGKEYLLQALEQIGVRELDFILLTHVHIDHSGAAGDIAKVFPRTPVVCHPKAAEHLIDPQRLWEGSLKTLGEVAQRYGPISPVPESQVLTVDRLSAPEIAALATPGHAPHHYSYFIHDLLFAGEAGGVCISLEGGGIYMRPATPPRFILEITLRSIERLIAHRPQKICYGHVGAQTDAAALLQTGHDQLQRWARLVQPWFESAPQAGEDTLSACLADLLENDPLLSGFSLLPAAEQSRERFFLLNSLRGYWGYFSDSSNR
jgi:glyoxylase-like metal-dependent hydrolase (beta-lactamase superfamily II)